MIPPALHSGLPASTNVRAGLLLTLLLLLGTGCGAEKNSNTATDEPTFQDGSLAFYQPSGDTLKTIAIEIAETEAERTTGLMRQRSLGYDRGMLFVYDTVDKSGMWMKNTPLPLDIVFIAPDSQVINIARRTTPFSEKSIEPTAPKRFVVEVRAGFANRFSLTDSTRVRWTRTNSQSE